MHPILLHWQNSIVAHKGCFVCDIVVAMYPFASGYASRSDLLVKLLGHCCRSGGGNAIAEGCISGTYWPRDVYLRHTGQKLSPASNEYTMHPTPLSRMCLFSVSSTQCREQVSLHTHCTWPCYSQTYYLAADCTDGHCQQLQFSTASVYTTISFLVHTTYHLTQLHFFMIKGQTAHTRSFPVEGKVTSPLWGALH